MGIEVKSYERKLHDEQGEYYEERWVKPERFRQHYKRMAVKVRKLFPSCGISVLDIGCGTGRASLIFASLSPFDTVVGIDISKNLLSILKKKAKATTSTDRMHLILCDAENLPVRTSLFDLVMYWGTLHHLPNIEESLHEAKRVLKAHGFCSIHEPNRDSSKAPYTFSICLWALSFPFQAKSAPKEKVETFSKYEKTFCLEDLRRMLTKIGFSLMELRTVWFFGVMPSDLPKAIAHPLYSILNKIDESIESRLGKKCIAVFAICYRT
jgi:ubiquinone/menaquinone biosynthesis C-methylase UbiE